MELDGFVHISKRFLNGQTGRDAARQVWRPCTVVVCRSSDEDRVGVSHRHLWYRAQVPSASAVPSPPAAADAVSHSKACASTAIFIIEDDPQNGPDHVDSHRAPVWVISPYTRRAMVDSSMYNQTSVLRTMELILGLRPMTHFDDAACPMFGSFSQQPDARPYAVLAPKTPLTDRNPGRSVGSAESARMDFSEADLADNDELNDVLWRAIKHSDPPAPTRSAFSQ